MTLAGSSKTAPKILIVLGAEYSFHVKSILGYNNQVLVKVPSHELTIFDNFLTPQLSIVAPLSFMDCPQGTYANCMRYIFNQAQDFKYIALLCLPAVTIPDST